MEEASPRPDDQPVEVRFRHNQRELARHMLRNMFRDQGWIWRLVAVLFLLAGALVLLLAWLGDPSAKLMGFLLLGVAALAVLVLAMTVLIARTQARRVLSTSRELAGELIYRFYRWGFAYESAVASARVEWGALHKAIEREDAFVLFPSSGQFVLLPKRGFPDAAAQQKFGESLREAIGSKARLRAVDQSPR